MLIRLDILDELQGYKVHEYVTRERGISPTVRERSLRMMMKKMSYLVL